MYYIIIIYTITDIDVLNMEAHFRPEKKMK